MAETRAAEPNQATLSGQLTVALEGLETTKRQLDSISLILKPEENKCEPSPEAKYNGGLLGMVEKANWEISSCNAVASEVVRILGGEHAEEPTSQDR